PWASIAQPPAPTPSVSPGAPAPRTSAATSPPCPRRSAGGCSRACGCSGGGGGRRRRDQRAERPIMPIISIFFGIVIRINFGDHAPPHLHAEYQGDEALFDIRTGE